VGVGESISITVTVTPLNAQAVGITLGCSNLPTEATCTFANPVIPAAGGSTTLVVSTVAPHNCGSSEPYFVGSSGPGLATYALPALAGIAILFIPGGSRRRRWLRALFAVIAVAGVIEITGCGNCTDLGTRPNTYTIQVTGTATGDSTKVEVQNVTLNVTI
jgi:hypothetical protein